MTPSLPTITLNGVAVHAISQAQCVEYVMEQLAAECGGWIITPNLDHLCRASKDARFAGLLNEADLVVADGMPLVWASRLQRTALPERVPGSALVWSLAEACSAHGYRLLLLGGEPRSADDAGTVLRQRYLGLNLCTSHCPPKGFENDPARMQAIHNLIESEKPDFVYVALGSPKQEHFIHSIRNKYPHIWWIGVGISLSFISGQVKRAPEWMQRAGLEWVHRLRQEPRRLLKRYLIDDLPFAVQLMAGACRNRFNHQAVRRGDHPVCTGHAASDMQVK